MGVPSLHELWLTGSNVNSDANIRTQTASAPGDEPIPWGILTWVLSFDDLSRASTKAVVALRKAGERFVVGRGQEVSSSSTRLEVPDPQTSKTHITLERRVDLAPGELGGAARVSDAVRDESKNGTAINGNTLPRDQFIPLNDGDLIQVGRTLLCYRCASVSTAVRLAETDVKGVLFGLTPSFCPAVVRAADVLSRAAIQGTPILLLGESGVGKESAAQAIHEIWASQKSDRRHGRLVAVNCSNLPDGLFESAFFGHVRGAFTGANEEVDGHLHRANGGTLFLDEVGSLSPQHQAKLLRVMEDGLVCKVGGKRSEAVHVRYVAATNEDVSVRMRPDLRFRLSGTVLQLAPLRERREDLGTVIHVALAGQIAPTERVAMTPEAARVLCRAVFPGNIRQLRNAIQSAVIQARTDEQVITIGLEHLPTDLEGTPPCSTPPDAPIPPAPPLSRPAAEPNLTPLTVQDALQGRTKKEAADVLGISTRHLDRVLLRMGLHEKYRKRERPLK